MGSMSSLRSCGSAAVSVPRRDPPRRSATDAPVVDDVAGRVEEVARCRAGRVPDDGQPRREDVEIVTGEGGADDLELGDEAAGGRSVIAGHARGVLVVDVRVEHSDALRAEDPEPPVLDRAPLRADLADAEQP